MTVTKENKIIARTALEAFGNLVYLSIGMRIMLAMWIY